jgi:CBS domain-containing protein
MTSRVHVAGPQTQFKVLVRLLEENRISAIPIVDLRGVPVGVVSESDLLLKDRHADLVAADLMTSPAISVTTDTSLADAARVMQKRHMRRLIVVDERGRIAGIVTRSDLLQVFLRTDEDLRDDVVEKVIPAILIADSREIDVDVQSNVVTLAGNVDRKSDAEILIRVTRELDGVVGVVNRLTYRWDDLDHSRFAHRIL